MRAVTAGDVDALPHVLTESATLSHGCSVSMPESRTATRTPCHPMWDDASETAAARYPPASSIVVTHKGGELHGLQAIMLRRLSRPDQ